MQRGAMKNTHSYKEFTHHEKGQAAMEFLMTYGWAILACVTALGVLAYFGVFKQGQYSPQEAYIVPPFYANGVVAENAPGTSGQLQLELANHGGDDYTITGVDATGCGSLTGSFTIAVSELQLITIPCDASSTIALANEGAFVKGTFAVKYTKPGSTLEQTAMGQYTSKVRRGIIPYLSVLFSGATPANGSTLSSANLPVALSTYSQSNLNRYSFVDFDNSLVGWWRFDDTSGGTVFDSGTYGNNGSISFGGSVSASTFGSGFNLTSPGSWMTVPIPLSTPSLFVTKSKTISAWIYIDTNAYHSRDFYPIVTIQSNSMPVTPVFFSVGYTTDPSTPTLQFILGPGLPNVTSLTDNTWHHIVASALDDSVNLEVTYYVDGIQVGQTTSPSFTDTQTEDAYLTIGADLWYSGANFPGYIDEVLIFNRSLSSGEVASLYDSRATSYSNIFTSLDSGSHVLRGYTIDSSGNISSTSVRVVNVP